MERIRSRDTTYTSTTAAKPVLREKGSAAGRSWQLLTASREKARTDSELRLASCLQGSAWWFKTGGSSTTQVCYPAPGSLFWRKWTSLFYLAKFHR